MPTRRDIATNQPYGGNETWQTTFVCDSNQFVKLKFEAMDITDLANDILKIQFLTSERSKPKSRAKSLRYLNLFQNNDTTMICGL